MSDRSLPRNPFEGEPGTIEERIVAATLSCINADGIESATTRRIAERAGVNSAAINYYFRSKDRLIETAIRYAVEHQFGDMVDEAFASEGLSPKERLRWFFMVAMEGVFRYPGLVKAFLYHPLMKGQYETSFVRYINDVLAKLQSRIREASPSLPQEEMNTAVVTLFSSAVFTALLPDLFKPALETDFRNESFRKTYIESLVDRFFPKL